mgnify:CR=1 FL=1
MNWMNWSKKLYITTLLLGFIYGALKSLLYVLDEPTTFEETVLESGAASFPSLTFCFRQYEADNFTTFSDVMLRLKQLEDDHNVQCTLEVWGKGIERQFFDLRNETVLSQKSLELFCNDAIRVFEASDTLFHCQCSYSQTSITRILQS